MMPGYAIQIITAMVCAYVILIWIFHLRSKYQKEAIYNIQCKFITEQGTSYKRLIPVIQGFVEIHPDKKRGKKGKAFPVADFATYQIEYPEGWVPRFLKTTIREAIWREDTWEPMYNRGEPLLNPEMLYNVKNEKFTEVGLAHSQSEAEAEKRIKEKLNPHTVYLLLGVVGVGIIGVIVLVLVKFNEVSDFIEKASQSWGW